MIDSNDEHHMSLALEACQHGIDAGQTPFGACLIRDDQVIACEHNRVWHNTDITAHAEIVAIRKACQVLDTIDLSGCTIYSTTEPCPMCFTAIHWAKIHRVVFGTSTQTAQSFGFNELVITDQQLKDMGGSSITLIGGCLHDQCLKLLQVWQSRSDHRIY